MNSCLGESIASGKPVLTATSLGRLSENLPWTKLCSSKIYTETPNFSMTVFGDGAFDRQLGLDDIIEVSPHDGTTGVRVRKMVLILPCQDTREKVTVCQLQKPNYPVP